MDQQRYPKVIASVLIEQDGKFFTLAEVKDLNLVSSAKWLFENIKV